MQFPAYIPFVDTLGFQLVRYGNGEAELSFDLKDAYCNSWGVAHGGVVMTLLDVAMAHAAKSGRSDVPAGVSDGVDDPHGRGVATIEMKTSFMRPGSGRLVCQAKVLTQTSSLSFCEARVFDGAGALAAHATGTFKVLRSMPAGGRRLERPGASD